MPAQLELYFSGAPAPELQKTIFVTPKLSERLVACRGRSSGAFQRDSYIGQFSWSAAVQAATVLLLRTAASGRKAYEPETPEILEGQEQSLASSLDYAISKEPNWLLDMFGLSEKGESNTRRLFRRTNPERKRGGSVLISVDRELLPAKRISVFIDDIEVNSSQAIYELASCIGNDERAVKERKTASINVGGFAPSVSVADQTPLHTVDAELIYVDVAIRIQVLNKQGDAKISIEDKVDNLGPEEIVSMTYDIWSDAPCEHLKLNAWDSAGRCAQASVVSDQINCKRISIALPEAIPPFSTGGFGYSYVVPGMFGDPFGPLFQWSFRVRSPTGRLSMVVIDSRYRDLETVITLHESGDHQITGDMVKTLVRNSHEGVIISWTRDYPPLGDVFNTCWAGRIPSKCAGSGDEAVGRLTKKEDDLRPGLC